MRGRRLESALLCVVVLQLSARALAVNAPEELEEDSVDKNVCANGCKLAFVGDRNCDLECYNEACQWDGGDCKENWEIRRTVVLGPFYREVDYVEYTAVGPDGEQKKVSMEEGRHWEGIDVRTSEEKANWRRMLKEGHKDVFASDTGEGRPPWYVGPNGEKVPAYRTDDNGIKWAIDKNGDDLVDENNNPVAFAGQAGGKNKVAGLDYEYDDYYQEDYD